MTQERTRVITINNKTSFIFSVSSSIIFLVTGLARTEYLNVLSFFNTPLFLLYVLGSNLRSLLFKNEGKSELTSTIFVNNLLGISTSVIVGHVFALLGLPYYASITIITLSGINIMLSLWVHENHEGLSYYIDQGTIIKLVLMVSVASTRLLVFLFSFSQDQIIFYFDDQNYVEMAINFTNNKQVLAGPFDTDYPESYYPLGMPIYLGINLATTSFKEMASAIIFSKLTTNIASTGVVTVLYSFCSSVLHSKRTIIACMISLLFNQWLFSMGLITTADLFFFLFLSSSIYFFYQFLKGVESRNSLYLAMLCVCLNVAIKPNGWLQFSLFGFLLILNYLQLRQGKITIDVVEGFKQGRVEENKDSIIKKRVIQNAAIIMAVFCISVPVWFAVSYYLRNGFTPLGGFFVHPLGFFGPGQGGNFTPTDHFSVAWLWEKLSFNIPRFVLNFTDFIAYFRIPMIPSESTVWLSVFFSFTWFGLLGIGVLYTWFSTFKSNKNIFFFFFASFWLNISWILLIPFHDFNLYRYLFLSAICIIPNYFIFLERVEISHRSVSRFLLVFNLAYTIYGLIIIIFFF
jgi:hypothetical protein